MRFPISHDRATDGNSFMKACTKFTGPILNSSPDSTPLAAHPANELDFGRFILKPSQASIERGMSLPLSAEYTLAARQKIYDSTTWPDVVPVICTGWAMSFITLLDGRRQILSFLLPGDIMSTTLIFGPTADRSVETITQVTYRTFNRSDLKSLLSKHPDLMKALSKLWIDEKAEADQLAIDLGRRTAEQRLARLILKLMQRLTARGMAEDGKSEFPLRQHQIADATGLTPVHVSRVLSNFRRKGLIAIDDYFLSILDTKELRRVAGP